MIALLVLALPLAAQFEQIAAQAQGRVGIAATLLSTGETVSLRGSERFPMQSVYKLPIAMAALPRLDLNREVRVSTADYVWPSQHSPLRDSHPDGANLTIRELLRLMVSESDGSACDVVLRLLGGPAVVDRWMPVRGIEVRNTEREIGADERTQYENSATPLALIELLRILAHEKPAPLIQWMRETGTGPKRIKGLLPPGTVVAHKTGSSRTISGKTAATNDAGLVTLPDGRQYAIAVFVSDSTSAQKVREAVIARAARAAWDYWLNTGKSGSRP